MHCVCAMFPKLQWRSPLKKSWLSSVVQWSSAGFADPPEKLSWVRCISYRARAHILFCVVVSQLFERARFEFACAWSAWKKMPLSSSSRNPTVLKALQLEPHGRFTWISPTSQFSKCYNIRQQLTLQFFKILWTFKRKKWIFKRKKWTF